MVELNAIEARVLGSLMEKEVTTPENYPLSLNALVNACNQKSSREPVMELRKAEVRTALFDMEQRPPQRASALAGTPSGGLVRTLADARVPKFENRVRDGLNLRRDEFAVICLLLLRGPQTIAELRARAERMYEFEDNAAVATTLERLAGRAEPLEPLTVLLQRQPGAREVRWMHLLSGPVSGAATAAEYGTVAGTQGRSSERGRAAASVDPELLQRLELLEEAALSYEERLRVLEEKLLALGGVCGMALGIERGAGFGGMLLGREKRKLYREAKGAAMRVWRGLLTAAVAVGCVTAGAQKPATTAHKTASTSAVTQEGKLKIPEIKYETYTLPNGLKVMTHEDHRLPLVAVDLWYHVGPLNERPGRTGFAHLFEHMMFEGSEHVGEKAHIKIVQGAGATDVNGTTDFDRTNYFETLPANQLELGLWLESDRMGFLMEGLDRHLLQNQRDVVRNERRQGEGQPYEVAE